jgi:hypothetical protein
MTGHLALADDQSMRPSRHQPGPGRTDTSARREAIQLDDLLAVYVDWRESARAVADAYERWSLASGPDRGVRFAAYTATLDQEQKTAAVYAKAVGDLGRWLERSGAYGPQAEPVEAQ